MKFHRPQYGERRKLRKFAILPIWDNENVYWLEWVTVHQVYYIYVFSGKPAGWTTTLVVGDENDS